MSRRLLPLLPAALLSGCGIPVPNGLRLDIDGAYVGKVIGKDGAAFYDVTIVSDGVAVKATFRSREGGEEFVLTGHRSIPGATPVKVTALGGVGQNTPCAGGYTDTYTLAVDFYASQQGRGLGDLWRETCDPVGKGFQANLSGSGLLELTRP